MKKLIVLPCILLCQLGFAEELIIGRNSAPLDYLYELSKEEKGKSPSRERELSIYFFERCINLNMHLQFSEKTDNKDYYESRNRIFFPALAAEKGLNVYEFDENGFIGIDNEFLVYLESLDHILKNYDENLALVTMDYGFCAKIYSRTKNIFDEEGIPY